jgi:two-component system cell cycle response regulator
MYKRIISSLRSRLVAANLAMLLPLLILTAVSYITFERIMLSFDEVLTDSLQELKPITQLEYNILSATTPLHGYLIHGTRDELKEFKEIAGRVDLLFYSVQQLKSLKQEQQVILQGVEKEWKDNLRLADKIMAYRPPFKPESAVMMELFDLRLKKINQKLRVVRDYVDQEIIALNESAKQRHRKSSHIYMIIFLVSTLVAISIGILMGRTITRPLKNLEKAANEFSTGNMAYRIGSSSNDEIGRLSRTFDQMAQEIQSLVIHDPLTDLLNKREFEKRLEHEIARAKRYHKTLALLMVDIDHFKNVNDKYGHQVGDIVLRLVSSIVNNQTRSIDHVARYGGEELVLVLPEVSKQLALKKAEQIRQSIEIENFFYNEHEHLNITISIGVATFDEDARESTQLVAAADKALYSAKRHGRNRVEAYSSE